MRSHVLFSALLAAFVALPACTATPAGVDDGPSLSAAEALRRAPELVGTYHPVDGTYPALTLSADGTYSFDTGIRCITAPCPSGDTGTWRQLSHCTLRLVSNDAAVKRRSVYVMPGEPQALVVESARGTTVTMTKEVPQAHVSCAAVRCAAGTYCDDIGGDARCIPFTCDATAATCDEGQHCEDRPIVCLRAPCAPTAPACVPDAG